MEIFPPLFLVDGQVEPPKQDVSTVGWNPCTNLIPKKSVFIQTKSHPLFYGLVDGHWPCFGIQREFLEKLPAGTVKHREIFLVWGCWVGFFFPINHEDLPLSVLKRSRAAGNFGCDGGISTSFILEKVTEPQVGGPHHSQEKPMINQRLF